jgi:ABC-2 type transport system ATP-binding protein
MEFAIEATGLTKLFKGLPAVSKLDLSIRPKEIFGLLGPDGAGKTTTIRVLSTAMEQTAGEAKVLGMDVKRDEEKIRKKIGYMPQRFSLYRDLSVDENLEFFAEIFQVEQSIWQQKKNELLDFTQLAPFKTRKAQNLSGGMQKKLALACSLIHTPEILFLDEPTTGVDPISRREFWRILNNLPNMTVLAATPYMDEAERCHRVALMRGGKLLIVDTPEKIKSRTKTKSLEQAFISLVEQK